MSNKISNKSSGRAVLIVELDKNDKFKDAVKLIASSLVNNIDSEEEETRAHILEGKSNDRPSKVCSDCQCGKKAVVDVKTKKSIISKNSAKCDHQFETLLNKNKGKDSLEEEMDDNNDEASDFDDCKQSENLDKREEITEEKQKKRNVRKKNRKRNKRKTEKLSDNINKELNASTKSETKTFDNKYNNNNNNQNESNSNRKNKTVDKQKQNELNDRNNKEMNNKTNTAKAEVNTNQKNIRQSDVEEEELPLNSAYVTQIAQRKNKPFGYQKSIQTQYEVQDSADHSSGVTKNKSLEKSTSSNYSDSVIKNNPQNKNQYKSFEKPKTTKTAANQLTKKEKNQNIEKSMYLANEANKKIENNLFVEPINLLTQAIQLNSKDYRFYVNRSFCYEIIRDYRNALKDAETAIKLKPEWPKCHYRKGKALAGLKNYEESEIALKKVLTLEGHCIEAKQDLKQVRYYAIVDMGYDPSIAETYSSNFDSIKDALSALSLNLQKQNTLISIKKDNNLCNTANNSNNGLEMIRAKESWDDDDIYISDDDISFLIESNIEEIPTNPFRWEALWVGNVSVYAKLENVTTMFGKFGKLTYCNIFKGCNGGNFILVHYDNPESPTIAMSKYQGKVIPGVSIADTPLTIRFRPNKDQKRQNFDQKLESGECYYWRTTGCARGDTCHYKHIQANKGVDQQVWMCNPLNKNPLQK